jgi:hypothetical protein
MGLFLASLTPPLALTQVIHQWYALILVMASICIVLKTLSLESEADILALVIMFSSGIIAHATILVILLAFLLPLLYINSCNTLRYRIVKIVEFAFLISIIYWIGIYYIGIILGQTISSIINFVRLILRETTPSSETVKPWYTQEQSISFISWSLAPFMIFSIYATSP